MSFVCPDCGGSDVAVDGTEWRKHTCMAAESFPWPDALGFWALCIVLGLFAGYAVAG
jgi:hypothetical protein